MFGHAMKGIKQFKREKINIKMRLPALALPDSCEIFPLLKALSCQIEKRKEGSRDREGGETENTHKI